MNMRTAFRRHLTAPPWWVYLVCAFLLLLVFGTLEAALGDGLSWSDD
jgi:hypothetical protein